MVFESRSHESDRIIEDEPIEPSQVTERGLVEVRLSIEASSPEVHFGKPAPGEIYLDQAGIPEVETAQLPERCRFVVALRPVQMSRENFLCRAADIQLQSTFRLFRTRSQRFIERLRRVIGRRSVGCTQIRTDPVDDGLPQIRVVLGEPLQIGEATYADRGLVAAQLLTSFGRQVRDQCRVVDSLLRSIGNNLPSMLIFTQSESPHGHKGGKDREDGGGNLPGRVQRIPVVRSGISPEHDREDNTGSSTGSKEATNPPPRKPLPHSIIRRSRHEAISARLRFDDPVSRGRSPCGRRRTPRPSGGVFR